LNPVIDQLPKTLNQSIKTDDRCQCKGCPCQILSERNVC